MTVVLRGFASFLLLMGVAAAQQPAPSDLALAREQARTLDAKGDPARRAAYQHVIELANRGGQPDHAAEHRLALLNLMAGDRSGAASLNLPGYNAFRPEVVGSPTMHIPGPVQSFRRMAALSSQTPNSDLVAALARNMFTLGYHYSQRLSKSAPTEYLSLLQHYVATARELEKLAGDSGVISIDTCESAGPLLKIIGYRLRKGNPCGPTAVLETDDPHAAFLTIDSGFPLAELEAAFRAGKPFKHNVRGPDLPVLFGTDTWFDKNSDPLDQLIDRNDVARLYYAFSKMDTRTASALKASIGIPRLLDVAPVLDFYGESLVIENGHAVMPGGPERMDQWAKLAGADPAKPAEFYFALVNKDDGWLAAYADSLQQLDNAGLNYYFSNGRLERFYNTLRKNGNTSGAARPVFRPSADLLLLPARMRLGPDGHPMIPGGSATWKALFNAAVPKKTPKDAIPTVNDSDDVMDALYAKVRLFEENGLLNIFVALNEVDRRRAHQMDPATVQALAKDYPRFSHHYAMFADWPEISDPTILKFLKVCDGIVKVKAPLVKADALGTFQASIGLWEILARQSQIAEKDLGPSFDALISRFNTNLEKPAGVFDAGHEAVETLLAAAGDGSVKAVNTARANGAGGIQDTFLNLLAGANAIGGPAVEPGSKRARDYVQNQIRSALDSQHLVRLDTLFGLGDMLKEGAKSSNDQAMRLAGQLREFKITTLYASAAERNAAYPGYWTEKHIDQMRDIDIGAMIEKKQRGMLAPFLRDTLVGLNYAYYAPPGAEVMFHNPLFVRSHDFMGRNGTGTGNEIWGPGKISGTGWPLSGGGRLVGALSGLPYGLAEAEQDFLIPKNTQALIWSDLAPQMLISAVIPRFWKTSAEQQHWVAANQRFGEDLLAESAASADTRARVMSLLRGRIDPHRREMLERAIGEGRVDAALRLIMPAELYRLSRSWMSTNGGTIDSPAYQELSKMSAGNPVELSDASISRVFGVPRPKLSRSWRPELLGMAPLPALQGYSSRLMAESWESNNLHWARMADEMGLPPSSLQYLSPQLTQRLIEQIFANHHEDWPALLRALRETTDEYKHSAVAGSPKVAE